MLTPAPTTASNTAPTGPRLDRVRAPLSVTVIRRPRSALRQVIQRDHRGGLEDGRDQTRALRDGDVAGDPLDVQRAHRRATGGRLPVRHPHDLLAGWPPLPPA